ncbi:hypothetical protein DFJ58DRAFT_882432 [Suillus subalutaceus]|uniref:uncharacterized protein n=1 Tax=Suillus subalutaceus TaxID=48586 RepID=UPI001B870581|nr:uncharacterized protein DFJ58DRAFT_882432 [Suillus subalutaceus]KAG1854822.1 hypothetical protein DFJ58DRAFT_882432 [Suillus subalutaceus]
MHTGPESLSLNITFPNHAHIYGILQHATNLLILARINSVPLESLNVIIDLVDTLTFDLGSTPKAYKFIQTLFRLVTTCSVPLILALHLQPGPLLELLTQISLPLMLMHLTVHPPPAGPAEKFWGVSIPFPECTHENECLVYDLDGNGTSAGVWRGVERTVEGWKADVPCKLRALENLKSIWIRKKSEDARPDPMQNVSFNIKLMPLQEKLQAQVPLPYVPKGGNPVTSAGAILCDPDSADDINDSDDPDEGLDI